MIVVGTTVAPYKSLSGESLDWLVSAEAMQAASPVDLTFFAAIETDARGLEPHRDLVNRLKELSTNRETSSDLWTFSVNDNETEINGGNRLHRICMGRNLIHEYAWRQSDCTHILFLDSDLKIPEDSVSKLLEVGKPLVGGDVPAYCMGGPVASEFAFPVQIHWNTAGFLLVERDVFLRLRWRHAIFAGVTDDPAFAADAKDAGFGDTYVRKDVVGVHRPLKVLENRGHDLRVCYE